MADPTPAPAPAPASDDDTPQWVKDLFGRMADKIEKLEEKIGNVQTPAPAPEPEQPREPEQPPKRKRSWAFKD